MDRARGEQRGDGRPLGGDVAVVDDDDGDALGHALLRLVAQRSDRFAQATRALGCLEGRVEARRLVDRVLGVGEVIDGRRVDEERSQREQTRGLGALGEDRLTRPEHRAQAHHQALAQMVDRGVGDLGEALAQVVVHGTGPSRERRQR